MIQEKYYQVTLRIFLLLYFSSLLPALMSIFLGRIQKYFFKVNLDKVILYSIGKDNGKVLFFLAFGFLLVTVFFISKWKNGFLIKGWKKVVIFDIIFTCLLLVIFFPNYSYINNRGAYIRDNYFNSERFVPWDGIRSVEIIERVSKGKNYLITLNINGEYYKYSLTERAKKELGVLFSKIVQYGIKYRGNVNMKFSADPSD